MDIDFMNVCRICLKDNGPLLDLFPKNGVKGLSVDQSKLFIEKISSCYLIQIHADDELPKKICSQCAQIVSLFYTSQVNAKQSDQILKNCILLRNTRTTESSATNHVPVDSADALQSADAIEDIELSQPTVDYANLDCSTSSMENTSKLLPTSGSTTDNHSKSIQENNCAKTSNNKECDESDIIILNSDKAVDVDRHESNKSSIFHKSLDIDALSEEEMDSTNPLQQNLRELKSNYEVLHRRSINLRNEYKNERNLTQSLNFKIFKTTKATLDLMKVYGANGNDKEMISRIFAKLIGRKMKSGSQKVNKKTEETTGDDLNYEKKPNYAHGSRECISSSQNINQKTPDSNVKNSVSKVRAGKVKPDTDSAIKATSGGLFFNIADAASKTSPAKGDLISTLKENYKSLLEGSSKKMEELVVNPNSDSSFEHTSTLKEATKNPNERVIGAVVDFDNVLPQQTGVDTGLSKKKRFRKSELQKLKEDEKENKTLFSTSLKRDKSVTEPETKPDPTTAAEIAQNQLRKLEKNGKKKLVDQIRFDPVEKTIRKDESNKNPASLEKAIEKMSGESDSESDRTPTPQLIKRKVQKMKLVKKKKHLQNYVNEVDGKNPPEKGRKIRKKKKAVNGITVVRTNGNEITKFVLIKRTKDNKTASDDLATKFESFSTSKIIQKKKKRKMKLQHKKNVELSQNTQPNAVADSSVDQKPSDKQTLVDDKLGQSASVPVPKKRGRKRKHPIVEAAAKDIPIANTASPPQLSPNLPPSTSTTTPSSTKKKRAEDLI